MTGLTHSMRLPDEVQPVKLRHFSLISRIHAKVGRRSRVASFRPEDPKFQRLTALTAIERDLRDRGL
jgi:hypothetical protein